MTVYFELAFAENMLLDGVLLYLALKCARAKVQVLRLLLAAAAGGGEALLFPLFSLPYPLALLLKFLGGLLLALLAVKGSPLTHFIAAGAFFALTFCLAGLLVALYSFFGVEYAEGEGYLVESAPVGLLLGAGAAFLILGSSAVRAFFRYRKRQKDLLPCRITVGERTVRWTGLVDSGNRLFFRGKPVCVISAVGALALFRGSPPVGRMRISTVNGSREAPVFACDTMQLGGAPPCGRVYFTVGEVRSKEYSLILHNSFEEGV